MQNIVSPPHSEVREPSRRIKDEMIDGGIFKEEAKKIVMWLNDETHQEAEVDCTWFHNHVPVVSCRLRSAWATPGPSRQWYVCGTCGAHYPTVEGIGVQYLKQTGVVRRTRTSVECLSNHCNPVYKHLVRVRVDYTECC